MLDTTPVTKAITRLISTGTTEEALFTAVANLFPNLSSAELSQALQVATTEAERHAVRRALGDPACRKKPAAKA
jgi:hypothetical protein